MLMMMMMFVCRRLQIRSLVSIWSKLITWAVYQIWPLNCRCVTVKPSTSTLRSVLNAPHAPSAHAGNRCSNRIHSSTVFGTPLKIKHLNMNSDMHSCSAIDPRQIRGWCLKLMCVFCAVSITKCNGKNNASVCGSSSNWCSVGAEKQSLFVNQRMDKL